jgi:hypothetical protein
VSEASPVNKTTLLAAVAADVAALKAAGDDGPPPTGTNPPKLALTPLAAAELATDVADAKEAFLDAVTAPKRVAAAAKAAPNASVAVETVKEAALDAALAVADYKAGLAVLPAETVAWAASLKLNGTDDLPSYLGDGKGDASAYAAAALVAANGGVVPPGVAALYPGLAEWLNAGADLAGAGAFNWYAPSQGAGAGRRRRLAQAANQKCAAVTLQAFPPTLRTGCPAGSPPPVAVRGVGLFAAAPPSTAPLSQTLLMLWQAFFTYVAYDWPDVLRPCASTQGYIGQPAVVSATVTSTGGAAAQVVAVVFHTSTDVFVAVQGSNSKEDFEIINADVRVVGRKGWGAREGWRAFPFGGGGEAHHTLSSPFLSLSPLIGPPTTTSTAPSKCTAASTERTPCCGRPSRPRCRALLPAAASRPTTTYGFRGTASGPPSPF